jgi:hypothetical protein
LTDVYSVCESKEEYALVKSIHESHKYDIDNLIGVLGKWRWMSGVNDTNQDEDEIAKELILIAKFVNKNYSELRIDEISLAIDMSLTNKLDVDVRTFNIFSPMYVSRILNAYVEYRKKTYEIIMDRKRSLDSKRMVEKKPSPEENMEAIKELIIYFWEQYQKENIVKDYFNTLYRYFRRTNQIILTKEEIENAQKYARQKASQELNDIMGINFGEKKSRESIEKGLARNYCVQLLFDKSENVEKVLEKVSLNHFIDV